MAGLGHPDPKGRRTHDQQQRIIKGEEKTRGADVPMPGETLAEARRRDAQPAERYDNSTGDRTIKRGSHQESEHHKERTDD